MATVAGSLGCLALRDLCLAPDSAKPLMCPVSELMVRIAMRFPSACLATSGLERDLERTARGGTVVDLPVVLANAAAITMMDAGAIVPVDRSPVRPR